MRDLRSLKKLAEWPTHGIDPHQLLFDPDGAPVVANGGVPRTASDRKYDLHRMDPSLVRLASTTGALLAQWRLDEPRLSLRHLDWSRTSPGGDARLGIAIQAEHDDPAQRAAAPTLAVLENRTLRVPTRANDGGGFAGDIAAAYGGGFVLSSHRTGLAQLWHPATPDRMRSLVEMTEATRWPNGAAPAGAAACSSRPRWASCTATRPRSR